MFHGQPDSISGYPPKLLVVHNLPQFETSSFEGEFTYVRFSTNDRLECDFWLCTINAVRVMGAIHAHGKTIYGHIARHLFEHFSKPTPGFFKRYIDDILGIFDGPRQDLEASIQHVHLS